jgi:hypothetical protein
MRNRALRLWSMAQNLSEADEIKFLVSFFALEKQK